MNCYVLINLNITGTEVHGMLPTSVITMATKLGAVTSYAKFSSPSDGNDFQLDRMLP